MFYGIDPTYILVIAGALLCLLAQNNVTSTYSRYSRVQSRTGMTGAMAAERILRANGIYDVRVEHIQGNLTDHYDPSAKVLRLSDTVYGSTSVAAIGVAAHECGHAIQHQTGYVPLKIRGSLVPVANLGSRLCWPLIVLGLFFSYTFVQAGIIMFCAVVLFQLVTLPVEFNASSRALQILGDSGMLYQDEISSTKKVLGAAALTYVASVASSVLQLLRLILLFGNRRDD
ncbi:MAG: zinc metallopeptidase [Lachnospiraceae bacterium]|nr:zinc metallopeptidase [Lachnospiraceae bacterium]